MKLLKLTMQAFGSFARETTVDFAQMEGLWLITGDTGAGKTTIFDAIVFALYGESSGDVRTGRQLRSDYADTATETYVELIFTQGGRTWTMRRSPSYERKRQRGEGTTTQSAACRLESEGVSLNKEREVAEKIRELLGVTSTQFRQLAMIAQNDFRRILEEESAKRQEMLRSMLGTERFARFEEMLKTRLSQAKERRELAQKALRVQAESFAWDEESRAELAVSRFLDTVGVRAAERTAIDRTILSHMAAQLARQEQQSRMADAEEARLEKAHLSLAEELARFEALHARFEAQRALAAQAAEDERLLPEKQREAALNARRREAMAVAPVLKRRNELASDALKAGGAFAAAQEQAKEQAARYARATQAAEGIGELRERSVRLRAAEEQARTQIGLFARLRAAEEELSAAKDEQTKRRAQAKLLADRAEEREHRLSQARTEAEGLPDCIRAEETAARAVHEAEKRMEALKTLAVKSAQLEEAKKTAERQREKCICALESFQEASRTAEELTRRYIAGQASQLAHRLRSGQPCPVCGSTEHPSPCPWTQDAVTQEQAEAAQRAQTRANRAYNDERSLADVCQAKAEAAEAEARALCEALGVTDGVQAAQRAAEDELAEKRAILSQAAQARTAAQRAAEEAKALDTALKEGRKALDQALTSERQADTLAAQRATALESVRQMLPEENEKAVSERMTACAREASACDKEAERLAGEQRMAAEESARAEATRLEKQAAASQVQQRLREAENAWTAALAEGHFADEQEALRLMPASAQALAKSQERLTEWMTERRTRLEQLSALAEELAGKEDANLSRLREQKAQALEALDQARQRSGAARAAYEQGKNIHKHAAEAFAQYDDALEKEQFAATLSEAASGRDGTGLSFEVYVQRYYYERVVALANRRLDRMTGGMYRLDLGDPEGRRSATGLDLIVLDEQTGRLRGVKTLSGGEKFKASLALALGMSDMVSAEVRSIDLGVLFIDEGFGTLDASSLQQAMDVLVDISRHSSKLVGVISHRPEMRECAGDHVITVQKRKNGSVIL